MQSDKLPTGLQTVFKYKGKLYRFTSLDDAPLDISETLKMIDEGQIPASPEAA